MSEPENPLPPSPSPSVGDTLAWSTAGRVGGGEPRDLTGKTLGDFQVERKLGQGGMGEVYLARQISLNRPVALKVLRSDLLAKPTYLSRFETEATAVAKLNHPNIVHIYLLGCVDDIRFIAMEYVQGTTLRDYLQKKGALELPLALSIMRQAGVAIGAAGEHGLVHRDIKPENLLLTKKGQVKVADFGLCRDKDSEHLQITQTGVTMGTPLYMSPEQAQGHAIDHRSDLYSLGVTFYHMLSGAPPFRADTPLALALKHVKDEPVSLGVRRPDIPPDLDRLVMKLIAKDPDRRYQSAAEMLRDLARVRENLHAPSMVLPEVDLAAGTNGSLAVVSSAVAAQRPVADRSPGPPASAVATGSRPSSTSASRSKAASELSTAVEDHEPAPGRGRGPLVAVACLIAGLAWGWTTRPPDLLAEAAPQPPTPPALWMAPSWQEVERQPGPERQYHHAQLRVASNDEEAAWIAVPGYFPDSRAWCSKAYIQLARALLRRGDLARVRVFAAEIARWNPDRMHEKELAVILQAAVAALDGNTEGVIDTLGPQKFDLNTVIDPALLELALEVTSQAIRSSTREGGPGLIPQGLRDIQRKLAENLFRSVESSNNEFREPPGLRRPG